MLYGLSIWAPVVHSLVTAVHVFAGVFWLGWMVFMFGILRPVLSHVAPERAGHIQRQAQQRIRRIVFWLIPTILLTGLYNMAYWSLLDGGALLHTVRGRRMLVKLGAAAVLFGVYYAAPFVLRSAHEDSDEAPDPADCHGHPDPLVQRTSAILHVLAFAAGVTAATLGVSLGA